MPAVDSLASVFARRQDSASLGTSFLPSHHHEKLAAMAANFPTLPDRTGHGRTKLLKHLMYKGNLSMKAGAQSRFTGCGSRDTIFTGNEMYAQRDAADR